MLGNISSGINSLIKLVTEDTVTLTDRGLTDRDPLSDILHGDIHTIVNSEIRRDRPHTMHKTQKKKGTRLFFGTTQAWKDYRGDLVTVAF